MQLIGRSIAALLIVLATEVPLSHFILEGGLTVFLVIGLGTSALVLEMQRLFLWFVLRDHSEAALAKATATPLYLAAGTTLLGLLGTALGYYVVLYRWSTEGLPPEVLKVGLREPLSCVVLGTALSTLVVLLHGALAAGLRAIRVPEPKPEGDR